VDAALLEADPDALEADPDALLEADPDALDELPELHADRASPATPASAML
jgi:hypothetical protein